jgi:ribonuclease HII
VYDSKQLSAKRREALYEAIVNEAVAYGVGIIEASEIDRIGIRPATLLAMRSALMACEGVDYALVDAWTIPGTLVSQKGLIRGDATERLIAAASILAKVTRDRLMVACASEFPSYGFAVHKGYGTAAHRAAIRQHGMSPLHRKTFTCL